MATTFARIAPPRFPRRRAAKDPARPTEARLPEALLDVCPGPGAPKCDLIWPALTVV